MRVVIQRVSEARVIIEGSVTGEISLGLLVFLGIEHADTVEDAEWICGKIVNMRIFSDDRGLMNRSILEVGGQILVISQFTLHASTRKGNRPSFIKAAKPEQAIPLYEEFLCVLTEKSGKAPEKGIFGADMKVQLINDGPVTISMDSRNRE